MSFKEKKEKTGGGNNGIISVLEFVNYDSIPYSFSVISK